MSVQVETLEKLERRITLTLAATMYAVIRWPPSLGHAIRRVSPGGRR